MKYYFGYSHNNGRPSPVKWFQDDGTAVGGTSDMVVQKVEITRRDFDRVHLAQLEVIYPYHPVAE